MDDFKFGLIIVGVFANFGASLVIAWRLRKLIKEHSDTYHKVFNVEEDTNYMIKTGNKEALGVLHEIHNNIPNTFEYNGNKGKIYRK